MRNEGYLCKSGSNRNLPTQRSMEAGLFEVKESVVDNPDGSVRLVRTTKVTGKGQIYFVNKFFEWQSIINSGMGCHMCTPCPASQYSSLLINTRQGSPLPF